MSNIFFKGKAIHPMSSRSGTGAAEVFAKTLIARISLASQCSLDTLLKKTNIISTSSVLLTYNLKTSKKSGELFLATVEVLTTSNNLCLEDFDLFLELEGFLLISNLMKELTG